MKKLNIIFIVIILLLSTENVCAKEKIKVTLNKCVDGDTAYFNYNDEKIKARFLAINTPESTNKIEMYGKEASEFTCNKLKNAKKIEIEYDENSDKKDKYGRDLVWVYVDNKLLQELLLKEGLAEIKYLYNDYEYTEHLKEVEKKAKEEKINIWSLEKPLIEVDNKTDDKAEMIDYIILISAIIIIIIGIFFKAKK